MREFGEALVHLIALFAIVLFMSMVQQEEDEDEKKEWAALVALAKVSLLAGAFAQFLHWSASCRKVLLILNRAGPEAPGGR